MSSLLPPALDRLRAAMAEKEIPALLVSATKDVAWLTGFFGSFGRVIVTPTDAAFLTDSRYGVQAREQVTTMPVEVFQAPRRADEVQKELLTSFGVTRLAFQSDRTTVAAAEGLAKAFEGVELLPVAGLLDELRMRKSDAEIEKIRRACALADAAHAHVLPMIQPGISELQLALEIEFFFRRQGAKKSFEVIAVSGANSARPHGVPTEKPLEDGDLLTLDFGAELDGYCSDITRSFIVGSVGERQREIYNTVLRAQEAALAAMKPGVSCGDIDQVARDAMGELATHFGHSLGHGLGLDVHDPGGLRPGNDALLEPGQVWTVEPGIYLDGFGGVRIEDDVLITDEGIEFLTHAPKARY